MDLNDGFRCLHGPVLTKSCRAGISEEHQFITHRQHTAYTQPSIGQLSPIEKSKSKRSPNKPSTNELRLNEPPTSAPPT